MTEPCHDISKPNLIINLLIGLCIIPISHLFASFYEILLYRTNTIWNMIDVYALLYFCMAFSMAYWCHPRRHQHPSFAFMTGLGLSIWAPLLIAMFISNHWLGASISMIVAVMTYFVLSALTAVYHYDPQDIMSKDKPVDPPGCASPPGRI
jgi:hypothetical protein